MLPPGLGYSAEAVGELSEVPGPPSDDGPGAAALGEDIAGDFPEAGAEGGDGGMYPAG